MDRSRLSSALATTLAALVVLAALDAACHEGWEPVSYGALAPLGLWRIGLLAGAVASWIAAMHWVVRRLPPVARSGAAVALGALTVGLARSGGTALDRAVGETWSRDAYVRVPHAPGPGAVYSDIDGGDCGYVSLSRITVHKDGRVILHRRGGYVGDRLFALYAVLGVWPHGEWTERGELAGDVVWWHNPQRSPERIALDASELRLDPVEP